MTGTAERTDTTVRTIRMYDDAWDLVGDRHFDHSTFVRDMTDAGLDSARCRRCRKLVPVEFRDLTGRSLAEWVTEARKTVDAQHRTGHHPVVIGNGTPSPTAKAAPAVFRERGGNPGTRGARR